MDKLRGSIDDMETERDTNVRRLDRARIERRSDEPRAPEPDVEARDTSRSAAAQKPAQAPRKEAGKRRSLLRPVLFALLPVALVIGAYFYVTGGAVMETDNAYVQAETVGLSTDVSGMVQQVLVTDNQKVSKGDVLFKLDPKPFQLALERAEAQVGNTKNELLAMQASYRNMEAQVKQAKAD